MAPSSSRERSVTVQSILYGTDLGALERTLEALDASAALARREGLGDGLSVVLGDASPEALLDDSVLAGYRDRFDSLDSVVYEFFGENTGTAKGHNAMARLTDTAYLVTSNPDIVPDARALWRMLGPLRRPERGDGGGQAAARGAPQGVRRRDRRDGLGRDRLRDDPARPVRDARRLRRADLLHVLRRRRLLLAGPRGRPRGAVPARRARLPRQAPLAHRRLAAHQRGDLLLRPGRPAAGPQVVAPGRRGPGLGRLRRSTVGEYADAVAEFERRRDAGLLVAQRDPEHRVGYFTDGYYTKHRYTL